MNFETIEKVLLEFGFKDHTHEWYESWKVQKVFRYKNMFYLVLDPPNVEFIRKITYEDESLGLTVAQLAGFLTYLSLNYNERKEITDKKLHLDVLYKNIIQSPKTYSKKVHEKFVNLYESLELRLSGGNTNKDLDTQENTKSYKVTSDTKNSYQ